MRKWLILFSFFLICFHFSWVFVGLNRQIDYPQVHESRVDYSEITYEEFPAAILEGEWEFYPYAAPGANLQEISKQFIEVPGSWSHISYENDPFPASAYGLYRLIVELPAPGMYSLRLGRVNSAYRLDINGETFLENGVIGTDAESEQVRFFNEFVTFRADTPELELRLYVSNFFHLKGGIITAPVLALPEMNLRIALYIPMITLLFSGILLAAAFFTVSFNTRENPDHSLIYIALFCLMLSIRMLVLQDLLPVIYTRMSSESQFFIKFFSLPVAIILFFLYSREAFPSLFPGKYILAGTVIPTAYGVLMVFTKPVIYLKGMPYFLIYLAVIAVIWLIRLISTQVKKEKENRSYFILTGSAIFIFCVVLAIVFYLGKMNFTFSIQLTAFVGFVFFIITHTYVIWVQKSRHS